MPKWGGYLWFDFAGRNSGGDNQMSNKHLVNHVILELKSFIIPEIKKSGIITSRNDDIGLNIGLWTVLRSIAILRVMCRISNNPSRFNGSSLFASMFVVYDWSYKLNRIDDFFPGGRVFMLRMLIIVVNSI